MVGRLRLARWSLTSACAFGGCALIMVACDLDLKPYVEPVEGGIPFTPTTDAGSSSSGSSGQVITDGSAGDETGAPSDAGLDGGGRKRVFVTSTVTPGQMGGINGANALCNQRAQAAKLGGNFIAWLSVNNDNVINRITHTGPYFLVDQQTQVFASKMAITATGPAVPINRDESNRAVENPDGVWTGTQAAGTAAGMNCSNFTQPILNGLTGSTKEIKEEWTQNQQAQCTSQLHLYCFEL